MEYISHILVITGIYVILTLSLNLIIGFTGIPALGHAAFACVGAYTSALLASNFGLSPWLGLLIGGSASGACGALIAFASLRLKEDYLISFIDPSSFTAMDSIAILLMVVFGGMASLGGSLAGAAILVIFPEILRFLGMPSSIAAPLRQMIYGLLLVVLMISRPRGIWGSYRVK